MEPAFENGIEVQVRSTVSFACALSQAQHVAFCVQASRPLFCRLDLTDDYVDSMFAGTLQPYRSEPPEGSSSPKKSYTGSNVTSSRS